MNEERAQHGESEKTHPKALKDKPAPVRSDTRSHQGAQGCRVAGVKPYEDARRKGIQGRSQMNKAQRETAVEY